MITVPSGYPRDNKIQILKISKAFGTLSCYLFRFTIQTQREQSSQCQRTLVRLLSLSVLGYLNFTLASNQNNNNAAASVSQGSTLVPEGTTNLFPIVDVDGAGLANATSTTTFVSDKNVVSAQKILPSVIDSKYYNTSADFIQQDVKSFLAKPVVVQQGVFSTTDTASTFALIQNPSSTLNTPLMADKLKGFLGFRATTVYRIVFNANRFQQGRYILSYVALGGADRSLASTSTWVADHSSTLVQRTTLPHLEIDLCCDTEGIIKIPFNSAMNFFSFAAITAGTVGSLGVLQLTPYSPLSAVTGNVTASFTIYSYFEDVQLVSAAVPQSGRVFTSRKKSETQVEQDSMGVGPVSSALIKVRDASAILGNVPLLSSYANTVSWFSDILASSAKVFGWSKPVSLEASNRMTQNYLPYAANLDSVDMSFPLSLSVENAVGPCAGFSGTDVDEMSFQFLATIPVWAKTISWPTSAAANTQLTSFNNGVADDVFSTTVNTATIYHYSPLQFLAQHFEQWRGSMVYKIKLVKTEFHSGRLLVYFNPANYQVAPFLPADMASSSYAHRQIIDIRETNEFTFVVPYIADSSYRETSTTGTGPTGTLYIMVLDPLVAPATVSQSVTLLLEKAGGPDMEFAVPQTNNNTYIAGVTPQSGPIFSSVPSSTNVCSNMNATIGSSSFSGDGAVHALDCVGEKVQSVRSLLKLPFRLIPSQSLTINNFLFMVPFGINCAFVNAATNVKPQILCDLYSRFASMYVYSRGGVRVKFLDNMAVTNPQPIAVQLVTREVTPLNRQQLYTWSAVGPGGGTLPTDPNGMPTHWYRAGYSGEVQVPQYSRYHSRVNSHCVTHSLKEYGDTVDLAPNVYLSRYTAPITATADCNVIRSGSDDLNFGNFLSVPPMILYDGT